MNPRIDLFREALEGAIKNALADIPRDITAAIWNATDDERGRLVDENKRLSEQLDKLNTAANRALNSMESLITEHDAPSTEALGARYELRQALVERIPIGGGDHA